FADEVAKRDVFLNVTGGWAIKDPGLDLAVAAAVLGAHRGLAVDPRAVVIGEIGLRGEVRPVPRTPSRLKEARALGFRRAYIPAAAEPLDGIECIPVERLDEVLLRPETIEGAAPVPT
ncbi:MAG: magnesium chelatase domain-containing protein, partial [Planctomycetota bacterium]